MSTETPTVQSSKAEVWYLKQLKFGPKTVKIITQNFNGPCSFIAICNILILRENIEILPPTRNTVSYEFLSQLVAEYLLKRSPEGDISAALSIMPDTQKGMDLNPVFTSSTSFHPAGAAGELKLFEQAGISLVHGWLVDPQSMEAQVLSKTPDYDSAVTLIADADHLANGQVVLEDSAAPAASSSSSSPANLTDEQRVKIEDALVIRHFLESTQSQLTYHGLFNLSANLPPNTLVALFRNSHLSVLYKYAPPSRPASPSSASDATSSSDTKVIESPLPPALYTLVTDQVFLHEPSVIWERLEDIDGGWSTFVDSDFLRANPAGGDFAGQTAEEALRAAESEASAALGIIDPVDLALAQQLQAEEEEIYARREHEAYLRERQRRMTVSANAQRQNGREIVKAKKKPNCVIM